MSKTLKTHQSQSRKSLGSSPERTKACIASALSKPSNIKVIARFRPLLDFEYRLSESRESVTFQGDNQVGIVKGKEIEYYTLDRIFDPDSSQEEVYEFVGKPTIEDVLNGYNGTIFAYGQTGSGKTHTMMGLNIYDTDTRGVIPRSVSQIFEAVESDGGDIEYTIKCSMLEIYKETLKDLLDPQPLNLKIKQCPSKGIYVQGLTEVSITSEDDMLELLSLGEQIRSVASTRLNKTSSRSHLIFIIEVCQKLPNDSEKRGKLNLVDLAGSEKVSLSGVTGTKLEETKKINLSLSALGNVIHALSSKADHIPYRDSKLTRLLQESLGGNYKTTLLVTCSPSIRFMEETYNTLSFAIRAKAIKNKVKINIKNSIDSYLQIIEQMKLELDSAKLEIQLLRGERELNSTVDSKSLCSTPANKKIDDKDSHSQINKYGEMRLAVSIEDLRSNKTTDSSRFDKKSPESIYDLDSLAFSFDKPNSEFSLSPYAEGETFQKIVEKFERDTTGLNKKVKHLSRENQELVEKTKKLETELISSRTKLLKAEQLSHEYYEIYAKTALNANKESSEIKALKEQNDSLHREIKKITKVIQDIDDRQKRMKENKLHTTFVEFEELTDASIPKDYVPIITEENEAISEQTTAFNLETVKVELTTDAEQLNLSNVYSSEIKRALEGNAELNREISIFHLKSQIIQAGIINANLMKTIHALNWKIELQEHKYQMKKTLCRRQEDQIRGLEKMIDHLHISHMHMIKLLNQIDHEKIVPKVEFNIPRSLILKPFSQKQGRFKSSRTPKPVQDHSADNSIQGTLSLEVFTAPHDHPQLNIRFKAMETSLELQKMYNLELKKSNEFQKQQVDNYKNILQTLEQDIFKVQRVEKDRWSKFFSDLKENCEKELIRKQTEVIKLHQLLGEWIDKFMTLQECISSPEKLLPKHLKEDLSFLVEATKQAVLVEGSFKEVLPKTPLKKSMRQTSVGYIKPTGDNPI
ncbi:unnamed protein product [Blepharisma stoltei]|uniref:Kinesin-like protein n=1 Tax=Blepharisma stoltei TaxID=1481888 RepID=A0AAU9IKW6_9CILI|nr:unnamed protein product [Blepharisma stoltei]